MSVGTFFFISVIIIQFNFIRLPYFFSSQHGDLVLRGFQWVSFGNLTSLASSVFLPQGPCTYWWLVRAKPFPISALVLWLSCDAFQEMLTGYSVVSYFQVHQAPSFFPSAIGHTDVMTIMLVLLLLGLFLTSWYFGVSGDALSLSFVTDFIHKF